MKLTTISQIEIPYKRKIQVIFTNIKICTNKIFYNLESVTLPKIQKLNSTNESHQEEIDDYSVYNESKSESVCVIITDHRMISHHTTSYINASLASFHVCMKWTGQLSCLFHEVTNSLEN